MLGFCFLSIDLGRRKMSQFISIQPSITYLTCKPGFTQSTTESTPFSSPPLILVSPTINAKARLTKGDIVAFVFRGDPTPSTAEVVKVRENKERIDSGDVIITVHYDVTECGETSTPRGHSASSLSSYSHVSASASAATEGRGGRNGALLGIY